METLRRKNIRMKEKAWRLLHDAASELDENPAVILERLIFKHIDDRGDLKNVENSKSVHQH